MFSSEHREIIDHCMPLHQSVANNHYSSQHWVRGCYRPLQDTVLDRRVLRVATTGHSMTQNFNGQAFSGFDAVLL